MTGVVESGTGSALSGRGYTAAGKTGTAEHGDVSSTTPHAWFVGFSNVEDPDIVVSVIAEESGSGSEVAVPIAQKILMRITITKRLQSFRKEVYLGSENVAEDGKQQQKDTQRITGGLCKWSRQRAVAEW